MIGIDKRLGKYDKIDIFFLNRASEFFEIIKYE